MGEFKRAVGRLAQEINLDPRLPKPLERLYGSVGLDEEPKTVIVKFWHDRKSVEISIRVSEEVAYLPSPDWVAAADSCGDCWLVHGLVFRSEVKKIALEWANSL